MNRIGTWMDWYGLIQIETINIERHWYGLTRW